MFWIGAAFYTIFVGARTNCWAIAALTFRCFAIHFDQHPIINCAPESAFDRLQIWPVSVTRKLHPIGKPFRKIVYENLCSLTVAVPDRPRYGELAISIEHNPRPDIAEPSLPSVHFFGSHSKMTTLHRPARACMGGSQA